INMLTFVDLSALATKRHVALCRLVAATSDMSPFVDLAPVALMFTATKRHPPRGVAFVAHRAAQPANCFYDRAHTISFPSPIVLSPTVALVTAACSALAYAFVRLSRFCFGVPSAWRRSKNALRRSSA